MNKTTRFSPEVRDRAVRLVFDQQGEHDSQWAAIGSIASKVGCTAETLRKWVRQAERGARPRVVFHGVDFDLGPGEFVAVMGDSGVGKSTLLNLVAGLDRADTVAIVIDGIDLSALDDNALTELRRAHRGGRGSCARWGRQ